MKTTLLFLSVFLSASFFGQQMTYVPDDNFEQRLISFGYDDVMDNYVLTENISSVTQLSMPGMTSEGSYIINDLTGIQDFIALTTLNIDGNDLTYLDLSNNVNLEFLDIIGNNQLTTLKLDNNPNLGWLHASYVPLQELDLSSCSSLYDSFLWGCNLSCLNVKNGNNENLFLEIMENPNLYCVEVDDVLQAEEFVENLEWEADAQISYSEDCNNDCSSSTVDLNELSTSKNIIQILDLMGRETSFKPNTPLIYVYDDGSIEKVFTIE
ncbi:hypothetical protein N8927_04585 [Crocinitomicaceae bacterium]|nr:hypothetical protein [Crocinitomicaceae bacterium]